MSAVTQPTPRSSVAPDAAVVFGKTYLVDDGGTETEIFNMTLGTETIPLVPLRNWGQLDVHKWVSRGKLAASPPGLEITHDHVKIAGETVSVQDPEGCAKLARAFSEWLALEKEGRDLARLKAQARPLQQQEAHAVPEPLRFHVEVDNSRQVHVKCMRGKEIVAAIGLNPAGFKSLVTQGVMKKPHNLQVGALHDWVELDGTLFSFEKGNNDAESLEKTLNEQYLPQTSAHEGKDVLIFTNPASSTGFDIQFPVVTGGLPDNRRRALKEETLDLLQDPVRCGLVHKEIVIKIARPNLIFKKKTADGGERYLETCPENMVHALDEDDREVVIDLSHPVNYMRLSPQELAAVFNHPAIHKHSKTARQNLAPRPQAAAEPASGIPAAPAIPVPAPTPVPMPMPVISAVPSASVPARTILPPVSKTVGEPPPAREVAPAAEPPVSPPLLDAPRPNAWLAGVLAEPPIRHDWLVFELYKEMAATIGASEPGKLGLSNCWGCALGDTHDISDPSFKGIFLTEKGGFGFVNQEHIVRFNKGVAFLGTYETALEGIGVSLVAAGFDPERRAVFIVSEGYASKFGVPPEAVARELSRIKECEACVLSVKEALESPEPIEVIWTVPAVQENPTEPKAVESWNPVSVAARETESGTGEAVEAPAEPV